MEIEKKSTKRAFLFLGIAIIVYEFIFQFLTLGIDFIEMTLLVFIGIEWEVAVEIIYNSGIALSVASIVSLLVVGLILRHMPSFQKKEKITIKTIILFFILMQGLQLLGSYILFPMSLIAEDMGYNFDEAMSVASDSSILLSAFVYSVIVAPIVEEILCRGIIMQYLEKYGKSFAVLITAMLFGLLHQNIVQFPITMMIGILFGYLAQRYSLMAAILLHLLNNLSVEVVGWLGERYDIIWTLDTLFLFFCGFASIIIVFKKRKSISAFLKQKSDMPVTRWFFTTPLMMIIIAYFLFFTIKSVTPF